MTGSDVGPTEISPDRTRWLKTSYILGTEVGAICIEIKMLITRDGPLDDEDKGRVQTVKAEIADTIFQAVKLADEMGMKESLYDLYRIGKDKYNEKMKEYRELNREWI